MPAEWVETRELPVSALTKFPGNARRGNVPKIRDSIRANGQYRAIVVRLTGTDESPELVILAGNHTYDAVRSTGAASIRCEVIRCTDLEARKINLADNRLSDLALEDNDALAELLSYLDEDYEGTGWTAEDVERLITPPEPEPAGGGSDEPDADKFREQYGVIIVCADEDEQAAVLAEIQGQGYNAKALTS